MFEPHRTTPGANRKGRSWADQALDARRSGSRLKPRSRARSYECIGWFVLSAH